MLERATIVALLWSLGGCGGASLPILTARAAIVPLPPSRPTSCGPEPESAEPRDLTDIEKRMVSDWFRLPSGEPDLDACRAVCRRALGPNDDVASCFRATSKEGVHCPGDDCSSEGRNRRARSIYCGSSGASAARDPAASVASLPMVVLSGSEVIVCNLR